MGLKVIGAGFGRTGTASLKLALDRLGFGPCYHMTEVLANNGHIELWSRAADGAPDWDRIFKDYRAAVDFPTARYWRELSEHFPDAKVILSTRSPDSWFESAQKTILAPQTWAMMAPTPFGAMAEKIINAYFDYQIHDRETLIRVFREHEASVKAEIAEGRLLVFEAKEGWAPLCEFLGAEVPEEPFPRVNSSEEMQAFNQLVDSETGRAMFEGRGMPADMRAAVYGEKKHLAKPE